ncbi:DUF1255 family protein [Candidatus Woesearchaeota archaeon]|nr:DUF1255 family protein [Candidatus Woesearchaeota archaeon]
MNKKEAIRKLLDKYPNASVLRKENPEISDLLSGEFAVEPPNACEFPTGIIVSRRLVKLLEHDSTVGVITPGRYEFSILGNRATMIVLNGRLFASVNDGPESTLQKYGSIIAPAHTTLNLAVLDYVFYICQYKPEINRK